MSVPSGHTSGAPFAYYDPDSSSWRMSQQSLLALNLGESPVSWPRTGMTSRGLAYEQEISAPHTDASDCSSSLATPMANDWRGPNYQRRDDERRQTTLADQVTLLGTPRTADGIQHNLRTGVANPRGRLEDQISLLPTPTSRDSKGANQRRDDTCLTGALLPTPRATDGTKGGPNQRGSSGDLMLPSAVMLLPTPTTQPTTGNGHARNLGKEVHLLPTPRASDGPDSSYHGRTWSKTDRSLHTLVHLGELTNQLFDDGNQCSDG